VRATVDFWDDQIDVYRVPIRRGERLVLDLEGPKGTTVNLLLWRAGTKGVGPLSGQEKRVAQAIRPGPSQRLGYRAKTSGNYYVEVKLATRGAGAYTLSLGRKELPFGDVAQHARRVADDDDPRRDVADDDRAGAHERILADLDAGTEHGAAADPGASPDRRPLDLPVPLLSSAHEVVVRGLDAGRDEHLSLQRGVPSDVRHRVDLHPRADGGVVLDQRTATDDDVVADLDA